MPTVPSTETWADKNLEKKKLSDEIAILKGIKERANNDTKTAVEAADKAFQRLEGLKNDAKDLAESLNNVSHETIEFVRFCEGVIRETSGKAIKVIEWTAELDKIVGESSETLKKTKIEADGIHEKTVRETEDLSRKTNDLNVYHRRLKEHFEKYLPGHVITL